MSSGITDFSLSGNSCSKVKIHLSRAYDNCSLRHIIEVYFKMISLQFTVDYLSYCYIQITWYSTMWIKVD